MGLPERSDEELIAELRQRPDAGREAAVEELFARHYERVARWCLRFTSDRDAAADLAQDVFIKAHRNLASFRGGSRFSTWLYSIARNESINRFQRAGPRMEDESLLDDVAALEPAPDRAAELKDRSQRLKAFLATELDAVERRVFTLHFGDDMPLDTITRLLRLDNASGAKAFIVSARRKLARAASRLKARGEEI